MGLHGLLRRSPQTAFEGAGLLYALGKRGLAPQTTAGSDGLSAPRRPSRHFAAFDHPGLTQGALAFLTFGGNLAPALLGAVLAQVCSTCFGPSRPLPSPSTCSNPSRHLSPRLTSRLTSPQRSPRLASPLLLLAQGQASGTPGTDLTTLLLWSVPFFYAASAATFVYAGQSDGLRPGAADAGKPE